MICNECETVAHCTKYGCIPERIGKPKPAAQPAPVQGPLSFNCSAGCGACGVKLQDFVTHQTQAQEGDEWVVVATEPQIVSTCCGSPVEVWDKRKQDITANVDATPPKAQPAPVQPVQEADVFDDDIEVTGPTTIRTRYRLEVGTKLYTTPPAAQRQWVGLTDEEMYLNCPNWLSQEQCKVWIQQIEAKLKEKNAAAQPAVPDAIHHTDLSESLEYIQGWNDCHQAMLEMMK